MPHSSPWLEREREIEYPLVDARGQAAARRAMTSSGFASPYRAAL